MFCERSASSKEDVWPVWLQKPFRSDKARIIAERQGDLLRSWKSRTAFQVKRVCQTCNNGWMSQLENEVKPLFEAILRGALTNITIQAQSTIAVWAMKTAMVLEACCSEKTWFYTKENRQRLGSNREMPARTSVFMAKCVAQSDIYSATKNHWTSEYAGAVRAHVTTMAFGPVAIQVVTIRTPVSLPEEIRVTYDMSDGPWGTTLVEVWPVKREPLAWPPKHGLQGDIGLKALTERLNPASLESSGS
jgi:hypothetical protein